MDTLKRVLIYLIGGLVTVPFISTYVVYLVSKKIYHHKWRAIHQAVQLTNVFYIFSFLTMVKILFNRSLFWLVVLFHLLILMIVTIYQWKQQTEIYLLHSFKITWRISFLIFLMGYIILAMYGILKYLLLI